ncbi:hypothetical protein [Novosphingobium resinovorum]|uniref:hypothetical protein n=1 Tax=Novosphingobium resinovorum TaxID=158500 RepID=UPI002ED11F83|nr:hypothetical protein [Novosphingobium resinovorum]
MVSTIYKLLMIQKIAIYAAGILIFAMIFVLSTPDQYSREYKQAQSDYEAVLNGKAITLSGVRFYKRRNGGIYYLPGGQSESIACIRCPVDWTHRAQIKEIDYVTGKDGRKIAIAVRLGSGKALMDRAGAIAAMQQVHERLKDLTSS